MDKIYIGLDENNTSAQEGMPRCWGNTDCFNIGHPAESNTAYIYPISMTAMNDPEHTYTLSEQILQDVNNDKCVLLFDYTFESRNKSIEHEFDMYKGIITNTLLRYNIQKKYIYVDCNPYNVHELDLYFNRWLIELGRACLQPYTENTDVHVFEKEQYTGKRDYKVSSFNRRPDENRFGFVDLFKDNPNVLCTLGKPDEYDMDFYMEHFPKLTPMLPIEYDLNLDLAEPNRVSILTYELQQVSYVQVVNESLFHTDKNHMFINEKTLKPIACLQPFIISGMPGSLKHLHELGFKTFGEWWDESYDLEMDHAIRLNKIAEIVQQLSQFHHENLINMLEDMHEVLEFNRQHLISMPKKHSIEFYNQLSKLSILGISFSA